MKKVAFGLPCSTLLRKAALQRSLWFTRMPTVSSLEEQLGIDVNFERLVSPVCRISAKEQAGYLRYVVR